MVNDVTVTFLEVSKYSDDQTEIIKLTVPKDKIIEIGRKSVKDKTYTVLIVDGRWAFDMALDIHFKTDDRGLIHNRHLIVKEKYELVRGQWLGDKAVEILYDEE